jgi:glycosyltransferase involved in cell wall biosynthesis
MSKIALILNYSDSDWVSCNSIVTNIVSCYTRAYQNVDIFNYTDHSVSNSGKDITDGTYTHIVIADHRVIPSEVLLNLLNKITQQLPLIVVHVYGDFVLNLVKWKGIERILLNFKVKFVTASSAQCHVIEKLLTSNRNIAAPIPFPVNTSTFNFNLSMRQSTRLKFNIRESDFVLCYSGRLSLQKNVLHLISYFKTINQLMPDTKLIIAGEFDDLGIPYLGLARLPLSMETEFYQAIDSLPHELQKNIIYFGNLSQIELANFYRAADLYISLSCHNDEDFGMAPAEALVTGLPLFLTEWGGFKDFKLNRPAQVFATPISLQKIKYSPDESTLKRLMKTISNLNKTDFRINSHESALFYSIETLQIKYQELIDGTFYPFEGFSNLFNLVLDKIVTTSPFLNELKGYDDVYFELYNSYK